MMQDRRNYQSRSATIQRVLDCLRRAAGGLHLHELHDSELRPAVVERILKRLAIRGLVCVQNGRWVPRRILVAPAATVEPGAAA
jgi:hypothetical protein